jgi:conjugative relaxase-like TrwC/TraI family protein
VLSVAPLASGQASYYLSLTGYYTDGPEPDGYWYGKGAVEFGLAGRVTGEHLSRLCEGFDPHDERRLVRNAGVTEGDRARKPGDDLCFSAPKSVSVVWALADPHLRDEISKKMHRAVCDALDYIEEKAGLARVGAQGQELAKVPLTFALFEHSSSRLGDPNLHVHAVCPNLTLNEVTGRGCAIYSVAFYEIMMSAGAVFRCSLAEGMRELGFTVERDRSSFRLKGVSEALCDDLSKRRNQIVTEILSRAKGMEHIGTLDDDQVLKSATGKMAEIVNLDTRRTKEDYTREEIFEEARESASRHGLPEHYVENLRSPQQRLTLQEKAKVKEEIYEKTIRGLSEEHSHWSERDLTRRVAEEAQGKGLHARDVRELVFSKVAGRELVPIGELVTQEKSDKARCWKSRSEERFTTPENLAREGDLLSSVEQLRKQGGNIDREIARGVVQLTREKLAAEGKQLTAEQAHAIEYLTAQTGGLACLAGKAGTTKSTTIDACRLAWELAGKKVIGMAVAGVASDSLRDSAKIESDTLAMTLTRLKHGRLRLTKDHVCVLDEAGMVPTKLLLELVRYVERAGAKLVLVGDPAQLQPIGAGGPMKSIVERHGAAELTLIQRQREIWRREAIQQLSRGEAREALIAHATRGALHVTRDRGEAISTLLALWKADDGVHNPKDCLLLAAQNAEVRLIGKACQASRLEAGALGDRRLKLGREELYENDRVLLCKKDRRLGIENGFMGMIVAIDEKARRVTVRLDKDDREVAISIDEYGADKIKLGYCTSVHKSQGTTREKVHVLLGGHMMDKHLAYVAASRARQSTHLVVDHFTVAETPSLVDALRTLANAISRDRSKDLARDYIDRPRIQEQRREQEHALSAELSI